MDNTIIHIKSGRPKKIIDDNDPEKDKKIEASNLRREYYLKNKEYWNTVKKCDLCGTEYTYKTLSNHLKSKIHTFNELKHKLYIAEQQLKDFSIKK